MTLAHNIPENSKSVADGFASFFNPLSGQAAFSKHLPDRGHFYICSKKLK
jgi:hypothetical protein